MNENFSNFILGLNEETSKGKSCSSSSVYDLWVNKKEDCLAPNIYSETRGQLGNIRIVLYLIIKIKIMLDMISMYLFF